MTLAKAGKLESRCELPGNALSLRVDYVDGDGHAHRAAPSLPFLDRDLKLRSVHYHLFFIMQARFASSGAIAEDRVMRKGGLEPPRHEATGS